ncbi:Sec-independent protein translocase family protein [Xanthomonas campestris]|uniref:hypothetical protein n=1 Tax=Xanthomonas campestris TaxID=339 RepID=UPI001E31D87A|nr:hypothetical protein [Xanthomonas campestris]MCC8684426.1 hypothetical protein [Xanthomonas campestris]MCW1999435.1 nitrogen fixation protein FixH [Xanthomonas campestris]MEA9678207.1 hypothetical protein [Xanthomonas campestris pv. raphani]MEA9698496.1 hypothetical protein [Xanthomonas campestris pv. raphani]MEA9779323.1 hypothetical protein [Xanthomonas campestris pv. raphani]
MGSFSIWHWLIVLVFFGIIAAVISAIVWLAKRASRTPGASAAGTTAALKTTESRLAELDRLKSQQLITDAECTQRRTRILSDL